MKKQRIILNYKGNKKEVELQKVPKGLHWLGLMFSSRKRSKALLFEFKKPTKIGIHSFFVFYDFVAIWLDEKRKIIDFKRIKPFGFSFSPSEKFKYLIEIPVTEKYDELLDFLDGKRKV